MTITPRNDDALNIIWFWANDPDHKECKERGWVRAYMQENFDNLPNAKLFWEEAAQRFVPLDQLFGKSGEENENDD